MNKLGECSDEFTSDLMEVAILYAAADFEQLVRDMRLDSQTKYCARFEHRFGSDEMKVCHLWALSILNVPLPSFLDSPCQ